MRRKPSLEGRRWRVFASTVLALADIGLAATAYLRAQADKGVISDRLDRIQQAQAEQQSVMQADAEVWSPSKILINLDARCPVITTLGFFAAFASSDPDPAKAAELQSRYAELQKIAQPMADELKKMATTNPFVGRKFPAALSPRLKVMSAQLYGEVLKLYGDDSLADLKSYVATQSEGVYAQD